MKPKLRLGLRLINGLSTNGIECIIEARKQGLFESTQDLATRARLNQKDLQSLAAANALKSLTGDRHRAFWQVAGIESGMPLFETPHFTEADVMLSKPSEAQDIIADYATKGLSLGRHPLALLRPRLNKRRIRQAEELWQLPNDTRATVAGLVICRQRPGSAGNVIFVTLEDESGQSNIVIWPKLAERAHQFGASRHHRDRDLAQTGRAPGQRIIKFKITGRARHRATGRGCIAPDCQSP